LTDGLPLADPAGNCDNSGAPGTGPGHEELVGLMTSTGARGMPHHFAAVVAAGAFTATLGLLAPTAAGASPLPARAASRAPASAAAKKAKKSKKVKHIAKTDTGQFACAAVPVAAWTTALGGTPTTTPSGGGPGAEGGTFQSKCFVVVAGAKKLEVDLTDYQTPKAAKQFIATASGNFQSHPTGIGDSKSANESDIVLSFARRNLVAAMVNSAQIPQATFEDMARQLAANL
jgi:hypothetical protein